MKIYNFQLAKKIVEKFTSLVEVESVCLGMHEDWAWTAETIWEDGEYKHDLDTITQVAGIAGSAWATPTIHITLKNGEEHIFNCFTNDGNPEADALRKIELQMQWGSGPISSEVNRRRENLEVKDFKG